MSEQKSDQQERGGDKNEENDEEHQNNSEKKEEKQKQSTQDSVKKECEMCGKKFKELNYCVHCAKSICGGCRSNHCEDLLEEYDDARVKAHGIKKKVNRKITEVQANLDEIAKSYNTSESKVIKVFEELEEDLRQRKKDLLGDLRRKKQQETLPLQNDKKALERELGSVVRKFENSCNVSVTALRADLNNQGSKVDDSKYAHLCGSNYKAKECLQQFESLSDQSDELNQPNLLKFKHAEALDEMKNSIKSFAEIEVYSK